MHSFPCMQKFLFSVTLNPCQDSFYMQMRRCNSITTVIFRHLVMQAVYTSVFVAILCTSSVIAPKPKDRISKAKVSVGLQNRPNIDRD